MTLLPFLGFMFAGAVGWTLVEYFLHRFGAHEKPNKLSFRKQHLSHHGKGNWFAPWTEKLRAALPAVVGVLAGSWLLVGSSLAVAFTVGFASMYLTYEVIHRRLHTHPPRGAYSTLLRKHHFHHHFHNPKANHGVTSPVWDWVFGSVEKAVLVRVPRKLAPLWLTDAGHPGFELRGAPRRPAA